MNIKEMKKIDYSQVSASVAQALRLHEQIANEIKPSDAIQKSVSVKDQLARATNATQKVTHVISKFHSNWHIVSSITSGLSFAKVGFAVLNVLLVPILALVEKLKRQQLYKKTGDPNDAKISTENKKNYLQNFLLSLTFLGLVIPMLVLPAIIPIIAVVMGVVGLIGGAITLIRHAGQVKKSQQYIDDRLSIYKSSAPELNNLKTDALIVRYEHSLQKKIDENASHITSTKKQLDDSLNEDPQGKSKDSLTSANNLNQLIVERRALQAKQKTFTQHKQKVQYKGYTRMRIGVMLGLAALVLAGVALALFPPVAIAAAIGFSIAGVATVATIGFAATGNRLKKWWTKRFIKPKNPVPEVASKLPNLDIPQVNPRDPMQFAKDEYSIKLSRYSNAVILKEHYANQHLIEILQEINQHISEDRLPNDFMKEAIKDIPNLQQSINTAWYAVHPNHTNETHEKLTQQFQHILDSVPKPAENQSPEEENEEDSDGEKPNLHH